MCWTENQVTLNKSALTTECSLKLEHWMELVGESGCVWLYELEAEQSYLNFDTIPPANTYLF